jgi:hypothetical protein
VGRGLNCETRKDSPRSHTERTESEEEIMAADGIMKTTNFSARYAEQEQWRVDIESNKSETIDYGMRTSMESL